MRVLAKKNTEHTTVRGEGSTSLERTKVLVMENAVLVNGNTGILYKIYTHIYICLFV